VRQESDLCPYKPYCDVIVNATAHAPHGRPRRRFSVGLRVCCPDKPVPLPEPPRGLNPLQSASSEAQQAWQLACERARNARHPGAVLIDKTLSITGKRWFVRRLWLIRAIGTLVRWTSLGIVRPRAWRLSMPRPTTAVALRAEHAFGGQCCIDAEDPAAKRVAKRHRLKPERQATFAGAVALDAFACNPVGCGWAVNWYLQAKRLKRLPAPQIEPADLRISARHFAKGKDGKLDGKTAAALSAGFGVRFKGHPERARLVGTVDDEFVRSDAWLPKDFDFAVWNAAPPDQQTPFLLGDEIIELTNLCAANMLGAFTDEQGNTGLKFQLPQHDCFALVRLESGEMCEVPLVIDTVVVEPEHRTLALVWRLVVMKDAASPIRVMEARMRSFAERDALRAKRAAIDSLPKETARNAVRTA